MEGEGVRDAQTTCSRIYFDLKHRFNKRTFKLLTHIQVAD